MAYTRKGDFEKADQEQEGGGRGIRPSEETTYMRVLSYYKEGGVYKEKKRQHKGRPEIRVTEKSTAVPNWRWKEIKEKCAIGVPFGKGENILNQEGGHKERKKLGRKIED